MYERMKDRADSMMMSIVVEVEECTGFTVISCTFIKQTSTPSGSQPLPLRARHLPLPQGTALMMTALTRGTSFKQLSTHTPFRQNSQHTISPCARKFRLAEFAAKPADFRG